MQTISAPADLPRVDGYWYLATPYSRYPHGRRRAFEDACALAGRMVRDGVGVFCPIAHSHPIAVVAHLDPLAHDIWLPADAPLMAAAHGLVIGDMDGWRESTGVQAEIAAFTAADKPIFLWEDGR